MSPVAKVTQEERTQERDAQPYHDWDEEEEGDVVERLHWAEVELPVVVAAP